MEIASIKDLQDLRAELETRLFELYVYLKVERVATTEGFVIRKDPYAKEMDPESN